MRLPAIGRQKVRVQDDKGSIDILGITSLKKEKPIPHPAECAGIRDDMYFGEA